MDDVQSSSAGNRATGFKDLSPHLSTAWPRGHNELGQGRILWRADRGQLEMVRSSALRRAMIVCRKGADRCKGKSYSE